jgi:hypothetical protein
VGVISAVSDHRQRQHTNRAESDDFRSIGTQSRVEKCG